MQLAIHEEGQQTVIFREGEALEALENVKDTTLIAFFKFNRIEPRANNIKYQDFPKHCIFKNNKWYWRKQTLEESECPRTIGRINNVSPGQCERYFLRPALIFLELRATQT